MSRRFQLFFVVVLYPGTEEGEFWTMWRFMHTSRLAQVFLHFPVHEI